MPAGDTEDDLPTAEEWEGLKKAFHSKEASSIVELLFKNGNKPLLRKDVPDLTRARIGGMNVTLQRKGQFYRLSSASVGPLWDRIFFKRVSSR